MFGSAARDTGVSYTYHFISIMQFFVSKSLHFSLIVQTRPCSNMSVNILSVKFSGAWGHKGPHSRLASHSSNSTRSKLQLCSLPKLCGPKSWKLMSLAKRLWCAEQRLQPIPGLMTSTQIKVALLDCKSSLEVLPVDQHFGLCSDYRIHDCTYFRLQASKTSEMHSRQHHLRSALEQFPRQKRRMEQKALSG